MKEERRTSNQDGVFRGAIGRTITGFFRYTTESGHGVAMLVLDDDTGIALADTGAYWTESETMVRRHVDKVRRKLEDVQRSLQDVLCVSGKEGSGDQP